MRVTMSVENKSQAWNLKRLRWNCQIPTIYNIPACMAYMDICMCQENMFQGSTKKNLLLYIYTNTYYNLQNQLYIFLNYINLISYRIVYMYNT